MATLNKGDNDIIIIIIIITCNELSQGIKLSFCKYQFRKLARAVSVKDHRHTFKLLNASFEHVVANAST